MTRFPTAGHLASWAGRCPGQRESAGRRGSAKPRKGSPWLADVLTECAWAAVKTKDTYLSAYYRQVMRRQGKPKAVMAVTHKILVIAWHLLSNGALYDDPGAAAVRRSSDEQQRRRAIRQLEALGLKVTVEPREERGSLIGVVGDFRSRAARAGWVTSAWRACNDYPAAAGEGCVQAIEQRRAILESYAAGIRSNAPQGTPRANTSQFTWRSA